MSARRPLPPRPHVEALTDTRGWRGWSRFSTGSRGLLEPHPAHALDSLPDGVRLSGDSRWAERLEGGRVVAVYWLLNPERPA